MHACNELRSPRSHEHQAAARAFLQTGLGGGCCCLGGGGAGGGKRWRPRCHAVLCFMCWCGRCVSKSSRCLWCAHGFVCCQREQVTGKTRRCAATAAHHTAGGGGCGPAFAVPPPANVCNASPPHPDLAFVERHSPCRARTGSHPFWFRHKRQIPDLPQHKPECWGI